MNIVSNNVYYFILYIVLDVDICLFPCSRSSLSSGGNTVPIAAKVQYNCLYFYLYLYCHRNVIAKECFAFQKNIMHFTIDHKILKFLLYISLFN